MLDITYKIVEKGGTQLHYIEGGDPQGHAVVLLHGMKFKASTWWELGTMGQLAGAGFRGLALDMPGFGESPPNDLANDEVLRLFLRETGCQRPVLVGPSMGGHTAMKFAADNPGLLGGLVLIGAVGVKQSLEGLAATNLPTLLVWGENDEISPLENCEILHTAIKGSRKVIIKGAGHPCYLDQPGIWHETLLDYLLNLSARPGNKE